MAKKNVPAVSSLLLRWSDHIPASDVQDPLGLGLRGSARLASRLLYCITSITPRARYFSFIPWCIFDFQSREKGKAHALGLRDGMIIREQALTLGCIAHHDGEPCAGGGLVGSRDAKKWFLNGVKEANFNKMQKFSKNPALGAYLNSLVNLGLFVTEVNRTDEDEEGIEPEFTFDDIELSSVGLNLAKLYDQKVGRLNMIKKIAGKERCCSIDDLAEFGKFGGLCELPSKGSADRELLREIFFGLTESNSESSHRVRRESLLLILDLCRQLSADDWILTEPIFASAVYFNEVGNEESSIVISISQPLLDIATRWRMFYFHHYMSVSLEAMFSWLISHLGNCGVNGESIDEIILGLEEPAVSKDISEILGIHLEGQFGSITPSGLLLHAGIEKGSLDSTVSNSVDKIIKILTPFAENTLEGIIRTNDYLFSSTGLALPMILLSVTLARYSQWETTAYGKWLANIAKDPYLDLIPPVISKGLERQFDDWWNTSFSQLTKFVLNRYVIQQHQSMSYEKTATGDRCLIQIDGSKIVSLGGYDKIGMGNPRLNSAIQILSDLGLIEDNDNKVKHLTPEGEAFLKYEIGKQVSNEVS